MIRLPVPLLFSATSKPSSAAQQIAVQLLLAGVWRRFQLRLFFVSEREARQRHVPSRSNSRLLSSDAI